jgi:hypothetical protein
MRSSGRALNKVPVVMLRRGAQLGRWIAADLRVATMDDNRRIMQSLRVRRAVWSAVVAGCVGMLGAVAARPLVGAFHDAAPWVLPVAAAGVLAVLVLFALLFLPWITRRA